jgi:hypothetical protein
MRREQDADGVATHAERAGDRAAWLALLREECDLEGQLLATAPR